MKLLKKYIKTHKKTLWLTLLLAGISQIFSLLDPQIFRIIIDKFANNPGNFSMKEYIWGAGFLLLGTVSVAFVSRVAKSFQDYYTNMIVQKTGTKLNTDAIEHAFNLPYSVFEDESSGSLLEKFGKAKEHLQNFVSACINILFVTLVGIIFVITYSFFTHWSIGVFFILIIPTLGFITFSLGRKIKKIQLTITKERANLLGSSTETLRNVELVKSLGLEKQEIDRLTEINEKILNLELTKIKAIRKLSFIQGTFINFLRTSLLFLMLVLLYDKNISLGELFAILFYSFFIFNPLYELGNVSNSYYEARASLELVENFLQKPKDVSGENSIEIKQIEKIKFEDVSFKYENKNEDALSKINIEVNKGETIAFVGPSGSGKSTIIKLLTGLYKTNNGNIKINDIGYEKINLTEMRKRIGLVLQETQLFAGTIKENLLFANPLASDEEILEALKDAEVSYLAERNTEGINQRIGEGGIKLSGGERQRLAIARALIRKPDVLIFDEATSSLDSITEKQISKTIAQLKNKNIIKILVAHRLSTIMSADRIYVIKNANIVEEGSHEKLIKNDGVYSTLYKEQQS